MATAQVIHGRSPERQGGLSYWLASTPEKARYPTLDGDIFVSVAVVGGGIVGLTAALLLKRLGLTVAVFEADDVGGGVSGYTTGKVTVGHGLAYSRIERAHGADAARRYAASQSLGLELVTRLAGELSISCDLERAPNYVYSTTPEGAERVAREADAAKRAGLPVRLVRDPPAPFPARSAVALPDQLQLHPRRYLLGLAASLQGGEGIVYEGTPVREVRFEPGPVLRTDTGTVRATAVVIATHVPITDRGLFFARTTARRSYVVAGPVAREAAPEGMWISVGKPGRSVRTTPLPDGRRLVLVGGEGHRVGVSTRTGENYLLLERFASEHLGVEEIAHRWSTQDTFPFDGLPFIGRYGSEKSALYVATGFAGWGMTGGSLAGSLIADAVAGNKGPFADLYDPERLSLGSVGRLVRDNVGTVRHLVGGRLALPSARVGDLGPREGRIVRAGRARVAAYRDEDGKVHAVSATCTHMGCIVGWNEAEASWDCPCHGSRFDVDGSVIEGPATEPLAPVDLGTSDVEPEKAAP